MITHPQDIFEKLEFNKILNALGSYCFGAPCKERIASLKPFSQKHKIERMLAEVQEYGKCLDLAYEFPISYYESISDELKLLQTIDYVLEADQYLKIYRHLKLLQEIVLFFGDKEKQNQLPLLYAISTQLLIDHELLESFEKIFDEEGNIKPDASPELKQISRSIESKERELNKAFNRIMDNYKGKGFLTDNLESFKNSRRVLSVSAENKRRIKGIIHDESSTGKTVFIEPEEIIEINNELFEFEAMRRQEIYRILKSLSASIRPHLEALELYQKILIRYDLISAKSLFSRSYKGESPSISDAMEIKLEQAYHPLLLLLNSESGKNTIPFDLELDANKRMLVISGPNAGGKSVSLKAVGLIQLMVQSGIPVPVSPGSRLGIFRKLMIDIGDQQSLEGDLSTYSSRLVLMDYFTREADKHSLVLIDEFGSGSDPKMGGAIAEAVLNALIGKMCFGLITTHYSNIKNYAFKSENILNGAMLFDKEKLKPTYVLKTGQPGSSFAFELARQIGLKKNILEYAIEKAGSSTENVDKLLIELQSEKRILDEKIKQLDDEQKHLRKLIENYDRMKADLEIRRKKLKKEAREKAYQQMTDAEKELQALLKEAKKERRERQLQSMTQKARKIKEQTRSEISALSESIYSESGEEIGELEKGQFVRLRSGGETGKVIDFDDKKVRIQMGLLQIEVSKKDLVNASQPIESRKSSVNMDMNENAYSHETSLDIRGYSRSEAEASVQEFLDNALVNNSMRLKILHGKGSGALKKVVWSKAKEYKDIKEVWHPEEEFGGTGVSFISFK